MRVHWKFLDSLGSNLCNISTLKITLPVSCAKERFFLLMEENKTLPRHHSNKPCLVQWWASHGKMPHGVLRKGALLWLRPKPHQMYTALISRYLEFWFFVFCFFFLLFATCIKTRYIVRYIHFLMSQLGGNSVDVLWYNLETRVYCTKLAHRKAKIQLALSE